MTVVLSKEEIQNRIAKRVAQELEDGSLVNLGIGLPTKVANFLPDDINVYFQSENGFIGLGPKSDDPNSRIVNAGGQPVTVYPGAAFFDSATSFGIIRGGHVDLTVLGALEVAANGDIANYLIPGKMVPGMGGAMDLLVGAKKVIVAMEHTNKGKPKIIKECTLPLTAKNVVDLIITEMGVFKVVPEGIKVIEINEEFSFKEVQALTGVPLIKA
ncbi:3-oxoacid CoA-transferase subunit B [Streptococcus didelphis]|uniref:3-oxoacid CoA-transferase subunit B n=1 Tax=Streptococcus didelphis TaxID=102886 RepID=A0ABY9LHS1_9STRE|nr:3-oxoacid CoA-transferase subunit B [Streptococcus didelphis]WMB28392.1 3-oxoacid CoA-transferase subunit B [Streptococcus didelphis]WMB29075.1 3-oxoacid CoA-transferase subunit B [Streptococcus didelphis]